MSPRILIALLTLASAPARAASDDELPPNPLPPAQEAERSLLAQSHKELIAGTTLLATGGLASLGGMAAGIVLFLSFGDDGGAQGAFPAAVSLGVLGMAAVVSGAVCIAQGVNHRRRANPFLAGAAPFVFRF